MFRIFFLVLSLATGNLDVGMSNETYPTMEACMAAMPTRVVAGNATLAVSNTFRIVSAMCATEDEMRRKLEEQST